MSLRNKSEVSMISGPQFINLSPLDINPLMSKCEIKVCYLGTNRNRSYITREVADNMAKTLRGVPIVAAWNSNKEDYGDHGHVMHIEDGEITFSCKTVPYGFVAPDAQVWYQNFIDTDEFDNQVERTYLMTTGYLWTGQFEEITKAIAEGQPQSMELDEKTLDGHWAENNKLGVEFFIINDATFSKLCILGDDVEPCFEGSAVTSPEVSKNFSAEQEFQTTLFTMMNELKDALQSKGGSDMEDEILEVTTDFQEEEVVETEESSEFAAEVETEEVEAPAADETEFSAEDNGEEGVVEEFAKDEEEEEDNKAESDSEDDEEDDDEKKPANHSLEEYEALEEELETLRAEVQELREFKLGIENQQKDALINRYHMLSDEDKKDIIEHKSEYSIQEIEAKLALLYVQKNVDFSTVSGEIEETVEEEEDPITTFSLEAPVAGFAPGFIEALRQTV